MKITNIKVYENISDDEVLKIALKKNHIKDQEVKDWCITKKSVDARDKNDVHFSYSLDIILNDEEIEPLKDMLIVENKKEIEDRIVVVGLGPAGLFAAYTLAINGYNPLVIEQGKPIDERVKDVEDFINNRKLNTSSNIQFGEGGAGTFSDGKLTTNNNSDYNRTVLETFAKFGAPKEILYTTKAHIGTDNLRVVIKNMRQEIIRLGGEVRFNSKLVDFDIENNKLVGITLEDGTNIKSSHIILAIGHSARDTFEKIYERKIKLEPKPFSVGVRIEHKQELINKSQYGDKTKLNLPPADYKLVYHGEGGRSLYTFCMCPGGYVMASSSEEGTIVTNGMSYYKRDGENANSALLVNVVPEDFMKDDNPLNGIYYQKEFERKAFEIAGSNYNAPIQKVGEYLKENGVTLDNTEENNDDIINTVAPTYKPGVTYCSLREIFPDYINKTMTEGIKYFGGKIKNFDNYNSIMTAVESRSSSPVRIIRDDEMNTNVKGIHPCGEGAGYAGGIMTSAIDGIKVAKAVVTKM